MRRSLLLTASVLGLLICLIGGTGLFAALTDSAHTGTNSVNSAALPPSADLKLATAPITAGSVHDCGTYADDLASGLFGPQDITSGIGYGPMADLCIKNQGSAPVSLSMAVDQLTDTDVACTGDEAANGDASCGNDGAGELSSVVTINFTEVDCATGSFVDGFGPYVLASLAGSPVALGQLAPGQVRCFGPGVIYPSTADPTAIQRAQSDTTTWRFVFTGQA